jgi:hypothetical protein
MVNGATCTIDQPFNPDAGVSYCLTVWGRDGSLYTWIGALTGEAITDLPTPAGLVGDDLYYEYPYIISKVTDEKMKFRVLGVKRNADTLQATISGIEYRDELYLND